MPKVSSGILLYRKKNGGVEVLLTHMGGPFWAQKDAGSWSIPKGEMSPSFSPPAGEMSAADREGLLENAKREFQEELGGSALAAPRHDKSEATAQGFIDLKWSLEVNCDRHNSSDQGAVDLVV